MRRTADDPLSKANRQAKILEVVQAEWVERIEDLKDRMEELGFKVSVPTIRNDCKELGVTRIWVESNVWRLMTGAQSLANAAHNDLRELIALFVFKVVEGETVLVLKCSPGSSLAVKRAFDAVRDDRIIGVVESYDTVVLYPESIDLVPGIAETIRAVVLFEDPSA